MCMFVYMYRYKFRCIYSLCYFCDVIFINIDDCGIVFVIGICIFRYKKLGIFFICFFVLRKLFIYVLIGICRCFWG